MEYRQFTDNELKWIKSFERVMKKAPDTLFLFIGAGNTVFAKDEANNRYITEAGGMDGYATSVDIQTPMDCDGGDF